MRYVLGSRASIGGPLGSGRGGAAAWYLAGGVSAANCVAAYQPKGAASLAASYTNLANPGTYTAAPGTAPTFDTATGWTFDATSSQHLKTGVIPASGWSMLIRYSDFAAAASMFLIGAWQTLPANSFFLIAARANDFRYYAGSGNSIVPPGAAAAVVGLAGQQPYRNGSPDGSAISGTWQTMVEIYIAAVNQAGTPGTYFTGKIQAVAIYNTTLTAPQVAAISSAMSAL